MPIKRVQFPDGSIHRIEVPEGATDEQIIDFVKAQHPAAQAPAKQEPTWRDKLRAFSPSAAGAVDLADAAQHHLVNPVRGLGQLGAHALESGLAGLGLDSFAAKQHAVNAENDADIRTREADYQKRTPNNAPAYGGAAAGEILPWVYGVGELRALGMLPKITQGGLVGLALKGGALAGEGGAMGAAQPVISDGPYSAQKGKQVAVGAASAPLLAAGVKGTEATASGLANLARYATPAGREIIADARVGHLLGNDPSTIAALRQDSGIPGYEFTPAQAIGTPEAVQAERVLRNNGNTAPAFAARESANNAAARNHVAQVAGDDPAMQAAIEARRKATDPFRQKYLPEKGHRLLLDPSPVVGVLQKLTLSGNDTVRAAARKHLALLQEHMAQNGGKITTTALDDIRQGVGSTLRSIPQNGAVTPQEIAKYAPVSSAITDTLDRAIPGYRAHLAAYARHSQPINDMEAARKLLDAIDSGSRDAGGNQVVNLNQVKSLIAKDNNAEFPMSDAARQQIGRVLEVLQRRSIANNNVAAAGPGTAADLQRAVQASPLLMRLLGTIAGGAAGSHFGPVGAVAGAAAASEAATALNNKVAQQVGAKAASAGSAADALEAYRLRTQKPANVFDYLLPYQQPPSLR